MIQKNIFYARVQGNGENDLFQPRSGGIHQETMPYRNTSNNRLSAVWFFLGRSAGMPCRVSGETLRPERDGASIVNFLIKTLTKSKRFIMLNPVIGLCTQHLYPGRLHIHFPFLVAKRLSSPLKNNQQYLLK
jgi:hypothetical protein